jgi:hypothetical protein
MVTEDRFLIASEKTGDMWEPLECLSGSSSWFEFWILLVPAACAFLCLRIYVNKNFKVHVIWTNSEGGGCVLYFCYGSDSMIAYIY